ncbi:hypothetical protein FHS61_002651 [Altererythrobacter atlanticus]|uniref:Uncharacterized protein n=1 Tax=Croceibacterium atlanticum TaxID=1267766 RepID=A0A0F7KXK7_9SPHN|nr:hypothetical protein [Croceibacterium atlanticum]AKH43942.1 hypothetical protein WYH_02915 [Croceibacterium atlanticum]MBB5733608.1 hypothetical protein [Croceibacterium atlanticum]
MTNLSRSLVLGCSVLALAACGPEEIASPGANGDINIGDINVGGGTGGTPTPTPTGVTPAAGCPTIGADELANSGTITGPTGEWRVCTLPSVFSEDATLPYVPGVLYAMNGRVDIGVDDGPTADASDGIEGTTVDLTIEAGAIVYAATGRSYLVAQRGSTLNIEGEANRPVIFTSEDNVEGLNNNSSSQQWGGIVLLGRAPVSDCASGTPNPANQVECQQELEGALNPPSFGGNTPGDSSGSIEYLQIRYSGFTLAQGSELQSLTTGGVGSGTTISHVQSYNSSDDGVEIFGGNVNMDHFIVVGAEDDSFDIDTGAKADIQFALAVQRAGAGDRALELDSPDGDFTIDAMPRTHARFSNFTFWAAGGGSQAVAVRGAADLTMVNGVIVKPNGNCVSVNGDETAAGRSTADEAGEPSFESVGFQCSSADSGQVLGYINAGTGNVLDYTNTLTGNYLNGASETGFTPIFDVTALSSFFETVNFIGAVPNGADWTQGWTCDSATVSFGSGNSCQSLPVYSQV